MKKLEYGIADKAWHPVIGCDPKMSCAPRCWARKTVARVVECQEAQYPERAEYERVRVRDYNPFFRSKEQ